MAHQGTPIFMARAAVAGHPLVVNERSFYLYDLPLLSDKARRLYEAKSPERLKRFPQPAVDQNEILCTLESTEVAPRHLKSLPWSHEPRHDAESAFWLLVWWAVHLLSPDAPTPNHADASKIPPAVWKSLTNVDLINNEDQRILFLIWLAHDLPWLDPTYRGLEPLFQKMAKQIHNDLHWAPMATAPEHMRRPEFLHEALQRVIFDFLVEHAESEFMQLERHPMYRKAERKLDHTTELSMDLGSSFRASAG